MKVGSQALKQRKPEQYQCTGLPAETKRIIEARKNTSRAVLPTSAFPLGPDFNRDIKRVLGLVGSIIELSAPLSYLVEANIDGPDTLSQARHCEIDHCRRHLVDVMDVAARNPEMDRSLDKPAAGNRYHTRGFRNRHLTAQGPDG